MYFWQIKVFIGCKNDSVGCIYDSTNFFGCINVRRQQFFANNTATVNPLVVKMAASRMKNKDEGKYDLTCLIYGVLTSYKPPTLQPWSITEKVA